MQAALDTVSQAPAAQPVPALPDVAREISGRTFVFEPNPFELESVAFDFDDSAQAAGHVKVAGLPMAEVPVGMDGVYRFYFDDVGRQVAVRGSWIDPQTFLLEHNSVTANDQLVLQFRFQDDRVEVDPDDAYFGSTPTFEGRPEE
jgi:hypothetical protein